MKSHDIRAVFFDVDGTLTSFTTHEVPASTITALHRLRECGVLVFICTGRAPSQFEVVARMLPVEFDGIVAANGQYCFDAQGFLDTRPIDGDDVAVIVDWLDRNPDVVATFSECDYVYFNRITPAMEATWNQLGKTAPTRFVDDPHTRPFTHETFQISPFITPEQEAELVGLCRNVTGVRWHPDFTDMIPADGGNDIAMLRFAGIGVAMGNANDEVKAVADYVTDDVDHDGIMNALLHFGILQ